MPLKVFITGGTSGIGLELAKLYAREGHLVGLCGRDLSKLPDEITQTYPNIQAYRCDVTRRQDLKEAVQAFAGNKLHVMIANAGISVGRKTRRPDFDRSRLVIETNIFGVIHAFEAALELMLPQRQGHLVAISSVAGLVGLPGSSAYSASKAFVLKLCESYAIDLGPEGIRTSCICPGFIRTPLTDKNDHSMPFLLPAERGAAKIKRAIDRGKTLYIFPWPMQIVMVVLEKMPRFLYRFLMRFSFLNYSRRS